MFAAHWQFHVGCISCSAILIVLQLRDHTDWEGTSYHTLRDAMETQQCLPLGLAIWRRGSNRLTARVTPVHGVF